MSRMDKIYEWCDTELLKVIIAWQIAQGMGVYNRLFLIGKQGELSIWNEVNPMPEGFSLVCQERISPAWTKEQAFNYLRPFVMRFPCLPQSLLED